jgi:hypothetical protein
MKLYIKTMKIIKAITTSTLEPSNVIIAKRWLWLPDDGLCKPKHVGAAFMIFIVLIYKFMCISWTNKEYEIINTR